ncbi:hypothetical protein ACLOJK_025934 [Asimina triloba]
MKIGVINYCLSCRGPLLLPCRVIRGKEMLSSKVVELEFWAADEEDDDVTVEICHDRILVLAGSERETMIGDVVGDDLPDVTATNESSWLDDKETLPVEGYEDGRSRPLLLPVRDGGGGFPDGGLRRQIREEDGDWVLRFSAMDVMIDEEDDEG